jgi:acyl-coenzyme A synthetase/AMP-(fatty) acid ligase
MVPLLHGYQTGRPLAWGRGRQVSAGRALLAARRLAEALPPGRYAVNLCESLDCFLVAFLAALLGRRTTILPPTRLARTLAELRALYPDSVCIADASPEYGGATVEPWLEAVRSGPEPAFDGWPAIDAEQSAAILFTSGSTGSPQMHAKTWGELVSGAQALMRSIAVPPPNAAIVGTVPPQHMFGLETTVMLPLQSGTPVIAIRPAFVADLEDALQLARERASGGVWLMTTPLQLRAFHRDRRGLDGIASVITSTMPLDIELARSVEEDWRAPVREIYGCTEGGILAVRRSSETEAWTPAAGLSFAIADDGLATVSGGHLRAALVLSDRLRDGEDGRFELVGRAADLVKIAGKRGSLAALTRELQALPGVEDGAVFLPTDDAPRVAALAVAPGRTVDELRRELAQQIDAAYLPRPFLLVDTLPRTAAGKLSLATLREFLAAARCGARTPRTLTAHMTYARGHPTLAGHFPGRPMIPGAVLLASVEDVLRDAGLRLVECTKAKFAAPVLPEQKVTIRVDLEAPTTARFEIRGSGRLFASGDLRLASASEAP